MSTFEEILTAALALPPGLRAPLANHLLAKLEALAATEFQPNLDLLEQLIGSLDVQVK